MVVKYAAKKQQQKKLVFSLKTTTQLGRKNYPIKALLVAFLLHLL